MSNDSAGKADPKEAIAPTNAAELIRTTFAFIRELRPELTSHPAVRIDDSLDADLGLDSLSRVELIARIERQFNINLPETAFAEAQTLSDLLVMLEDSRSHLAMPIVEAGLEQSIRPDSIELPLHAATLVDVLRHHAASSPSMTQIRLLDERQQETLISYDGLLQSARELAFGLLDRGIDSGDRVAIMLPTSADYFYSFLGVLLAGAVPVPIYPPARISQLEDHMRRHCAILVNCAAKAMITVPTALRLSQLLQANSPSLKHVITVEDLRSSRQPAPFPSLTTDDLAFLQYTSGSTGNPKGVMLSHANLLANVKAMGTAIRVTPQDVFVSWLPLYHDMGLIGAWLGSLFHAIPLVIMAPTLFLARPQRWLWAMHRYRGTLSAAPNFAYELCLRRITARDIEGLDLSSWRIAFNGAEPVIPDTLKKFCERFEPHGFNRKTMTPVYGLAESAVGLSIPSQPREPLIDVIDRDGFMHTGIARPAGQEDARALRFVACGQPLAGHEIRIVDALGNELPERQQGQLQFRGPSSTTGYYRNPEATAELIRNGWLQPGDMGYIAEGDVYITGRSKDIIIRAGRNIYPHELEDAVGLLPGVRQGRVAVFGSQDPDSGTERLVIVAESRTVNAESRNALKTRINELATAILGNPPDDIVLAPSGTVLRTSSGKIRRSACRDLYARNAIGTKPRPISWQLFRLATAGIGPLFERIRQNIAVIGRGLCTWLMLVPLSLMAFIAVATLRQIDARWSALSTLARILARIAGVSGEVAGLENVPERPCSAVYVCNHSSYADVFVLIAFVPRIGGFVAKSELARQPLMRFFLERIGTRFVERFDRQQGVADTKRLIQHLHAGESLVIFPEGTFSRRPGLMPFHMGAFATAAQADVTMVPIVLHGTRSILRDGTWLPRSSKVTVRLGPPIVPGTIRSEVSGDPWRTALQLRAQARRFIAENCREPDLLDGQNNAQRRT